MNDLSEKQKEIEKEVLNLKMLDEQGKLNGEFTSISSEAYHHAECPAESRSSLMIARNSIAKWDAKKKGLLPWKTSPAKEFGSMAHDYVLENHLFAERYLLPYPIKRPEGDAKKLAANGGCKEAYQLWKKGRDEYLDENLGKKPVSEEDLEKVRAMRKNLLTIPLVREIIEGNGFEFENSYFYTCPRTGLKKKFRPDIINKERKIMLDFKTCLDSSPLGFGKDMANHYYDVQGAQYLEGAEELFGGSWTFGFIAIEKSEPYIIGLHALSQADREVGESILKEATDAVVEAKKMTEILPCYSQNFEESKLPAWCYTGGYR